VRASAGGADGSSPPLRVATFNIRNGRAFDWFDSWPLRRRATAEAVARLDADVVALQEVYGFQQRYLLRCLPGWRATGAGRTDGRERGERCAILWRSARLALERSVTRWFSDTPDVPGSTGWGNRQPRVVTLARFSDSATGASFGLADCHLEGWPPAARFRSAQALVDWLEPGLPWIVAGDLNAEPDDPAVATLLAAGLRDALTAQTVDEAGTVRDSQGGLEGAPGAQSAPGAESSVSPGRSPWPTGFPTTTGGFSGRGRRRRIDYLFVSREWTVDEAAVVAGRHDRRLPSDHWPVLATLRLA